MNNLSPIIKFHDPDYLAAQLMATQHLLLRLASLTCDREELIESGLESTEILRNTAFPRTVAETFLSGLDDFDVWLKKSAQ